MASVVPFLVGQFEITSHHSLVCMAPATASAVNLAGQVASKGNFVFLAFEMSFVITNFISGYEQSLSPPHWGAQLQVKLLFYPGGVPRQLRSSGHGLLLGQLLCSATSFASRMALTPVIGPMFSGKSSFLLNWASFRQTQIRLSVRAGRFHSLGFRQIL